MRPVDQLLRDPFELLVPLAFLGGAIIGGLIVRAILLRVLRAWTAGADRNLDRIIADSVRGPIVIWALILGLHLATQNSEIPRIYLKYVPRTLAVLWILSLTIAMTRLAGGAVHFYGGRVTGAQSVTSLTRKLAQLAVVALGIASLLRVFDVSLTPILTTLGVGGLAVALALQDTLSNLFAGFYVSISGLVHIGDYIKLNSGEEGYITDINWRCTMMRGTSNNLVIIPNSKLGQAIYTNYSMPDRRMGMSVSFGVDYESDVARVERILLEEATAAAAQIDGLLAEPAPSVLFNPGPSDSALVFQVNCNVADFAAQGRVQSELRKRLFNRLKAEAINMPFPTRTVLLRGARHPLQGCRLGNRADRADPLAAVLSSVPPGKALDLAAGSGRHSLWLAQHGWNVTAVDLEPATIPGVHFQQADLEKHEYRIAPAAWDLILCWLYWQPDLLPEIAAGVRPGGAVAMAGKTSGRFATSLANFRNAFPGWTELASGENEVRAFLIARRP
ncbi:MAG TPA: mechanosensitive ion channel domain-containing protein [Bryobacteraceae bacterium]|jgi:small-conductance mechanosensitive channel|nr:mechanosensitive ion channel domain-containing protein [Bryobacteraceae bacterium]